MKPRIVAFVDHEIGFRLLKKLISLSLINSVDLVAVVTTVENGKMWWPGVEDLCEKSGVPLFRYREHFRETLFLESIDWYLLFSWKYIIPPELISHPKNGVINLHYSLLPDYRGVYPVNWAIIDGKELTGITYHFVNEKIDDGEVILQVEAPVLLSDTARSLQARLDQLAYDNFDALFSRLSGLKKTENARLETHKKTTGSYKSRESFNEKCKIDLDRKYQGLELFNLLRGLTFLPDTKNAYFVNKITGKKLYVSIELREE